MADIAAFVKSLFSAKKNNTKQPGLPALSVWNGAYEAVLVNSVRVEPGMSMMFTNVQEVIVANLAQKTIVKTAVPGAAVAMAPPKAGGKHALNPWGILLKAHDHTRPGALDGLPMPAFVFSGFHIMDDGNALVYVPGATSPMAGRDVRVVAAQTGSFLPFGFVGLPCAATTVPKTEFDGSAPVPDVAPNGLPPVSQGVPTALGYTYPPSAPCLQTRDALATFPYLRTFGSPHLTQLTQAQSDVSPLWLVSATGPPGATPTAVYSAQVAVAQGAPTGFSGLQLPAGTALAAPPRQPVTLRVDEAATTRASTFAATNKLLDTLGFLHEIPFVATVPQVASLTGMNISLAPVSDAAECRKKDIQRYNAMLDNLVTLKLRNAQFGPDSGAPFA